MGIGVDVDVEVTLIVGAGVFVAEVVGVALVVGLTVGLPVGLVVADGVDVGSCNSGDGVTNMTFTVLPEGRGEISGLLRKKKNATPPPMTKSNIITPTMILTLLFDSSIIA